MLFYGSMGEGQVRGYGYDMNNVIFGMCFFSKFYTLHHKYNPGDVGWYLEDLGGIGFHAGTNMTNRRHYILEQKYGYIFSHGVETLKGIAAYIKQWNLGETYMTPTFRNKKYGDNGNEIAVMVWHWNGNVPPVSSTTLKDFPYDDQGNPVVVQKVEKGWKINVA